LAVFLIKQHVIHQVIVKRSVHKTRDD